MKADSAGNAGVSFLCLSPPISLWLERQHLNEMKTAAFHSIRGRSFLSPLNAMRGVAELIRVSAEYECELDGRGKV